MATETVKPSLSLKRNGAPTYIRAHSPEIEYLLRYLGFGDRLLQSFKLIVSDSEMVVLYSEYADGDATPVAKRAKFTALDGKDWKDKCMEVLALLGLEDMRGVVRVTLDIQPNAFTVMNVEFYPQVQGNWSKLQQEFQVTK